MSIIFSVLHATYGRPEKAVAAMRMWRERAARPESVQYILCADADDLTRFDMNMGSENTRGFGSFAFVEHPGTGSASAWDFAAKFSTGNILLQAQDDCEPPPHWDDLLLSRIEIGSGPFFMAVSDGYRKDFCHMAIMNRARYKQTGEFVCPEFISVFSDDDVYYRAKRDARDGKCTLFEARDLEFRHEHCFHNKSVPFDATYERENSSEAYRIGAALFAKRNPTAATDGLKTW